jgi:nucleoside-diphosphate-sugar epimerase
VVHPDAAGRVWLAADGDDLSTPALIRLLAQGQGCKARLFAMPERRLAQLRALPRIGPALCSLTLSMQVDDRETRTALGWTPTVAAATGLSVTARALALALALAAEQR